MDLITVILTGVGLSMDAFAVAISKGLSARRVNLRQCLLTGIWFGGFQALMPLTGYFIGSAFAAQIEAVDHWVAFGLLCFLGIRMIKGGLQGEEEINNSFAFRPMLVLAVATSIDALAAGIAFSMDHTVHIGFVCAVIGIITFLFSAAGVRIGSIFGSRLRSAAQVIGGIILIFIGVRILLIHLEIWS